MNKNVPNAIRILAMDMVEKAKSGHPGLPMGMADVMTVLYRDFLNFNPKDPNWPNRDRFILSAGHGSAMLYALLYLTGYEDMTIEQLQQFRQLHAKTAGHPEYGAASGIETTTGPLGQGLANAVGMAIAERMAHARHGNAISHKTYVLVGDGCLMEGISQEAISLAGHLKLKNLIVLFDDNGISIDGPTSLATSEDHIMRFKACGFTTISIDGHNYDEIHAALKIAQISEAPVLIACKTIIGYGSPNKAGDSCVHGSPLGAEEAAAVRNKLNWDHQPFTIPDDVLREWRSFADRCLPMYKQPAAPAPSKDTLDNGKVLLQKKAWTEPYKPEASRKSSEHCLNFLHKLMPNIVGGSADLTGSNLTKADGQGVITSDDFSGNYIHWGVREHGMAAMMNGMALYGPFIPYGGTFLVFADYLRPALRLSALMKQQVIYVMTHDSIGLGEDGPTHQPIEHLASLRAIPNLLVMRPCDRIETLECWQLALNRHDGPSLLALSRQALPQLRITHSEDNLCSKGAYILQEYGDSIEITIYASGSEVSLAKMVAEKLHTEHGKAVRVVSAVCLDLFAMQPMEYQVSIMCNKSLKVAIEAGCSQGWDRLIGPHGMFFGIDSFGESAPAEQLYKHFGLDADNITNKILSCLNS